MLDNKAQSGTVFRLLIDGIIGLAILAMIISSLSYFQTLQVQTSVNNFYSLVESATKAPNGTIFKSENPLNFVKGTGFTATGLRNKTGIDETCFNFNSILGFAKVRNNVMIEFLNNVNTKVEVRCCPTGDICLYGEKDCCEMKCEINFGKKLDSDYDCLQVNYDHCVPDCSGKDCGSNGCGGSCGSCDSGETCSSGQCISTYPNCNSCPSASTVTCGQNITVNNPCTTCVGKGTKCDTGKTCQNDVCVIPNLGECVAEENLSAYLTNEYLVIDISEGPSATNYPVTELTNKPSDLLSNDDYKTTKIVLRKVPACTFIMGSPEGEPGKRNASGNLDEDEILHEVTLTNSFYVGIFEVTQKQWELVYGSDAPLKNRNFLYGGLQLGETKPVHSTSWNQVRGNFWSESNISSPKSTSFMGKLSAKTGLKIDLPTEAMWEYICRAGTSTGLNNPPNGAQITLVDESNELISPEDGIDPKVNEIASSWSVNQSFGNVGQKIPNNFGVYDTIGNVGEWVLDIYNDYPSGSLTDPLGPSQTSSEYYGGEKVPVVRGYSGIGEGGVRCADRGICGNCVVGGSPDYYSGDFEYVAGPGFRIFTNPYR